MMLGLRAVAEDRGHRSGSATEQRRSSDGAAN